MPNRSRHALLRLTALAPLLLTGCMSSARWEPDERFSNVPLFAGQPLQAERAATGFSGPGYQVRLKASRGWHAFDSADMDRVAARLLRHYRGELGEYSGVRDERYFLVSIQPDVMVVAPFVYKIPLKTAAQIHGLSERVVAKVLTPLHEQIRQEQQAAKRQGLEMGWLAELPGPNYAELGCSFPDLPGATLWAPQLGPARPFDDEARALLAEKLKLDVRRHPTVPEYWQLVGCPS
ncbi:MAG TPA: hypothetical protein VK195_14290 [Burkholderiaceae bacterium]|nr:hypothetical protein [Burkholderiaceae bacterium]